MSKLLKEDDSLILVNLDGQDYIYTKILDCDDENLDNYEVWTKIVD